MSAPIDEAYLSELKLEFPRLRLIDKADDGLSLAIDRALRLLTFGGQSAYLTRYVTVIGQTIYLPSGWAKRSPESRYITLRHEAIHLRQRRRLGMPLMAFVYLVPFLPLGLALGRARLEWEAYAETFRATAEVHGVDAARDPRLVDDIVRQFTGPAYGWMWPFPRQVRRWIDEVLETL